MLTPDGTLHLKTARVFKPLLQPSRYKAAFGGRGSGKSHFFAELLVRDHVDLAPDAPGIRSICVREVLKSLRESAKLLIEDKIRSLGVGSMFEVQKDKINAPRDGFIVFEGMQDKNAESIKSFEGFDRCWVEEAQTLSERSLALLRPTIRKPNSEIHFTWNPRRKADAVDHFLRTLKPDNAIVVESNWRDNPWFPNVLETERQVDLKQYPERYDHIWEGGYAKAFEGAYFAKLLNDARATKRIGFVPTDPILPIRAFWDLGGAGAKADACAIWLCQWVGNQINVLDYIEGRGQTLSYYVNELRSRKIHPVCYLPHDGVNANNITGRRFRDHVEDAGFDTIVIPNQGAGAAMQRVEAVRRILPMCFFSDEKTEPGRDALGYYHERRDENRSVGLGPEHDWSSHAADAFGLMAICYEGPEGPLTVNSLFDNRAVEATRSDITGY